MRSAAETITRDVLQHDPDVFAEQFNHHKQSIEEIAWRYLGSQRDASDVVQDAVSETFANAWESIGTFDDTIAPFGTWLRGIAKNTCVTILRSRQQIPNWQDADGNWQDDSDGDAVEPWDRVKIQWEGDDDGDGVFRDGNGFIRFTRSLDDYVEMLQVIEVERFHVWTREERRRGWIKIKIDRQPGYKIIYNTRSMGICPPWGAALPLSARDIAILKEVAKRTPREEIAKKMKMKRGNLDTVIHRINKRIVDKV